MRLPRLQLAPLFIPWHRRMQTLSVAHYVVMFGGPYFMLISSILVISLYRLWWVVCLYLIWLYMDRETPKRGSRPVSWARNWTLFKHMRDYFPIRLIKTAELDPKFNYIIGYHPHGIMSFGAFCNFCTEANNFSQLFPGIKSYLCTLVGQFWFPFRREYLTLFGLVEVSRESIGWLVGREEKGYAAVVVVGGAREALLAHPGTNRLTLNCRKGFIDCALRTGAHLVPVYSFGENDAYNRYEPDTVDRYFNWQLAIKNYFGWTLPAICGRGVFNYSVGILPHRRPIYTVVGEPIVVERNENPTQQDVDRLHKVYIEKLQILFDQNKVKFKEYENSQLVIY